MEHISKIIPRVLEKIEAVHLEQEKTQNEKLGEKEHFKNDRQTICRKNPK
jgi:hypothetical protein